MRRPLLSLLIATFALAAAPAGANAWVVRARVWTQPMITYRAESPAAREAAGYAAWAWWRAGVRLVPARGPDARADVTVRIAGRCGGEATVGYRRPAFVNIGRCSRALRALSAVHEFGHVFGLAHENRVCARMNSVVGPAGTPAHCPHRSTRWWIHHPLLPDDIAGAHWIVGRARVLRAAASRRSDSNR